MKTTQLIALVATLLGMSFAEVRAQVPDQMVKAMLACQSELDNTPEVYRLRTLGILGDGHPTFQQMNNNTYASAADSGITMMYLERTDACNAPLHLPADPSVERVRKIFFGFANGLFTYGQTVLMMATVQRQLTEQVEAQKRCTDAAQTAAEFNRCSY